MLQIRLFRFDPHCDVASYFKPYVYESAPFADLAALLDDIGAHDPYFSAQGVEFVKIGGTTVSVKEPLDTLIAHFGSELIIAPLSEKEAVKDLRCEPRAFLDKFKAFEDIADVSDFEFYKSLAPYFYSTKIPACSREFLGNSAFIFAHRLMQTHPSERMRILEIIEPQMAYFTKCDAVGMEFDDRAAYRAFCDILKYEPARSNKILSAQSMAELTQRARSTILAALTSPCGTTRLRRSWLADWARRSCTLAAKARRLERRYTSASGSVRCGWGAKFYLTRLTAEAIFC